MTRVTDEPVSNGLRITMLAAEHPEQVAVVFAPVEGRERQITWAELEARSCQVARLLERRGVDETSMVVIGLRNSPEHVISAIAGWKLGACTLPLRWDLPAWERDRLLEVADPAVVVADWEDVGSSVLTSSDLASAAELPADPRTVSCGGS